MSIGRSVLRKEGRAKVTGQSRYVDDLFLPGMLHGATVRSPSPRGLIRQIHYGGDIPWDEFTVVTAADIPNVVALIADDSHISPAIASITSRNRSSSSRTRIARCSKRRAATSRSRSIRFRRSLRSRTHCRVRR